MVFGDPRKIKERHFKLKEYLAKESPESLDALISISSGNPVIRFPPRNEVYYLGLYNTIGRNSIPLFVGEGFHNRWEEKRKDKRLAQDATVTRVLKEPTKNGCDFLSIFGLERRKTSYAVFLEDSSCKIDLKDQTSFLEADFWAAYRVGGEEKRLKRCPDLSDEKEMMLSIDRMISKLEGIEKKVKLISQFDLVEKPFGASQTLDQDSDLRQRISNKRIRKKYVGEIKKFLQEYT